MGPHPAREINDQRVEVALVCAMAMELDPLVHELGLAEVDSGGPARLWLGDAGSRRVAGVVTGMGPARAAAGTAALLGALHPARVAVVGIAGAVADDAPIGGVVRVSVVIDGATGRRYDPTPDRPTPDRPAPGHPMPDGRTPDHPTAPGATPTGRLAGALWTTGEVITDRAEIARLAALGVVALDMETAAVAAACQRRRTPWSAFRAVSDPASDGTVEEYVAYLSHPDGSPDRAAMARYFALHPERAPAIDRLVGGAALAAEAAAGAALRALRRSPRAWSE